MRYQFLFIVFVLTILLPPVTSQSDNIANTFTKIGQHDDNDGGAYTDHVIMDNDYAYSSVGWDLRIISLSQQQIVSQRPITTFGFLGALELNGDIIYVGHSTSTRDAILVIDITDRSQPQVLGNVSTGENNRQMRVHGELLIVVQFQKNFEIFDISDPTKPSLIESYTHTSDLLTIAIDDDLLYSAGWLDEGLTVFNISNPEAILPLNTYIPNFFMREIAIYDHFLYSISSYEALRVIDISNPQELNVVSSLRLSQFYNMLALDGSTLVLGTSSFTDNSVVSYDLTNPASPTLQSNITSPYSLSAIDLKGSLVAAAAAADGIQLIDLDQPDNAFVSSFDNRGLARGLELVDEILYVADYDDGLEVLDVTNPRSPQKLGSFWDGGNTVDAQLRETIAYTADGIGGIELLDISDPDEIFQLGQNSDHATSKEIILSENYAFILNFGRGVDLFDISDPYNPVYVTTIEEEMTYLDMTIDGNYLYLAAGTKGLIKVDISNPQASVVVAEHDPGISTGRVAYGVAVQDGFAYVADANAGVSIYDASGNDLTYLETIAYDGDGYYNNIFVTETHLFIERGWSDIFDIYSLENPSSPDRLIEMELPVVEDVVVSGTTVIIAAGIDGVLFYELSYNENGPNSTSSKDNSSFPVVLFTITLLLIQVLRRRY